MRIHPGPTATDDGRDLAAFGYRQELVRSLGSFSSFAAGFSYLSILTGMFQLFHVGFGAGGPAFFWTWPLVFAGQFLVALCFAEMAAHYPLSGSVYQWARHIGSRTLGWIAGWIYLACLIVTMAAVVLALQTVLPQISPAFQIIGPPGDPSAASRNAVLLGIGLVLASTIINAVGVKLLAAINNVGVVSELLGVVFLAGILFSHAVRGPEVVWQTAGHGADLPGGYMTAFLAAALMASYVMYGFDTAGSLAEETNHPRQTVPRAILRALGAAAFAPSEGFALGRWGLPVNLAAVAFGTFMVVNVAWPRPEIYGAAPHMRFAAIWLTLVVVGLAVAHAHFSRVHVPATDPTGEIA